MTRRTNIGLLGAALLAASPAIAKEDNAMKDILEASQNDKKGLMLYVKGQSIAGIVVKIGGDTVELRSREYNRILVRIDAIDAVAMS
ncbi:exported hypothetical protein [Candidatus Sulfopaludibacter sp. SbA4]|nr:exported hypothetical protein [Candidatus Sulfopaludibacter sp. SbA4]